MATDTNTLAATFKQLHEPSSPVILPNIWDISSLSALLRLNNDSDSDNALKDENPVKAIATASFAIAESLGVKDEDLTYDQNMAAITHLAPHVRAAGLPLTVDLQDGYGPRIAEAVRHAVALGACGANIEDSIPSAGFGRGVAGSLYGLEDQVGRLRVAMAAARDAGCPDFVLNARCDVFRLEAAFGDDDEDAMQEAVGRGRAYLEEAGATTVFFWGGGGRGLRTSEVERLVRELGGKVAVKLGDKEGSLSTGELAGVGVARVSVGPSLYLKAMGAMREWARNILSGGGLDRLVG